jgi:hypothetical protein
MDTDAGTNINHHGENAQKLVCFGQMDMTQMRSVLAATSATAGPEATPTGST